VSPVGQRHSYDGLARRAAAILFLVDPDEAAVPLDDRLRALYSLTAAEARVAGAVAAGQSAADISDRFGVSRETARSQIKSVFDKAGVRSQSAFIRLAAAHSLQLVHPREE
jgi:DNA-binding CsgD family transcriptional regulator